MHLCYVKSLICPILCHLYLHFMNSIFFTLFDDLIRLYISPVSPIGFSQFGFLLLTFYFFPFHLNYLPFPPPSCIWTLPGCICSCEIPVIVSYGLCQVSERWGYIQEEILNVLLIIHCHLQEEVLITLLDYSLPFQICRHHKMLNSCALYFTCKLHSRPQIEVEIQYTFAVLMKETGLRANIIRCISEGVPDSCVKSTDL